jgi:hypothetical protein
MKFAQRSLTIITFLLIFLFVTHAPAVGQATTTGVISGAVVDQAHAVIVGARVTLVNSGSGFTRETVSNESGFYSFALLEPADYEVTVVKEGFKVKKLIHMAVQTHSKVVVNFELEAGAISETITVQDSGEVLKPTDVAVTSIVPQWQLKGLPLNDKLLAEFTRLEAGVTPRELTTAESGPNSDSGGFLHGLRQFFVHVTLDGGHFNDPTWPGGTMTNTQGISFDAVREFAVVKGNADATQASAAGYTINVTTRSGTSEFHGDVFEYFRNDALDARNFFDGADTQPLRRNQFGGAFGGPLPLRKHKDFFFVNYEGFRRKLFQTVVSIVPTDTLLERVPGGAANGFLKEIFTHTYLRPDPGFPAGALVAPATGSADLGMDRDMFVARLDGQVHQSHQAFARFNFINGDTAPGVSIRPGVRGGNIAFNWRFRNILLGLNSALSQRSANELRFTFDRVLHHFTAEPTPPELVALGFDPTANTRNGLPFIFAAGTGLTGSGVLPFVPKQRHSNVFELNEVFSITHGNHNLKTGGTIRRTQSHWLLGENIRPSALFIGFGAPFDTAFFGLTTARFLSQTENLVLDPPTPIRGFRFTHFATFFQDIYRVSKAVTLIFGLRYSFDTPITEVNGLLSNAYPVDPATGEILLDGDINNTTLGNLAIRTVEGARFYQFDKNNFAPNIGVSWMLNDKTSLKAGYGVTYGSPWIELIRLVGFNPPFGASTVLRASRFGTRPDPANLPAPVLNVYNPANVNPYVHYWNVTLEREFEKNTVIRAGYIGNHGSNLWDTRQPNFGAGFTGVRPNPNFSVINLTETKARSNYNGVRVELNRRFYQGLSVQATYVFSKALDDISAAVSTLCPQGFGCLPTDQRELRENYGVADFDVRHTAVVNFIYELPFGSGRRFLSSPGAVVSGLAGGWTISGIASYWDGLPFDVVSGVDNNLDGVANDRARVVPGAEPRQALVPGGGSNGNTQFLDPRARGTVLSQTIGTPLERNFFRGPAIINFDVAVQKSFNINERVDLKLAAEIFNIFNHTNFANPINSLGSPAFGRIISTSTRSREVQLGLKLNF